LHFLIGGICICLLSVQIAVGVQVGLRLAVGVQLVSCVGSLGKAIATLSKSIHAGAQFLAEVVVHVLKIGDLHARHGANTAILRFCTEHFHFDGFVVARLVLLALNDITGGERASIAVAGDVNRGRDHENAVLGIESSRHPVAAAVIALRRSGGLFLLDLKFQVVGDELFDVGGKSGSCRIGIEFHAAAERGYAIRAGARCHHVRSIVGLQKRVRIRLLRSFIRET